MLSCYHSTPYFWERVLFLKRRFIVCYFQFEISVLKCCSLFQFIRVIWFVWQDVAYSEWDMLGKWHIGDVGCWGCKMFRMWMFRMGDVRDVGCSGCGMFRIWDVRDVGCSGCGMFEMWDVRDVHVGCGMFAGMWDVDLQNAGELWDDSLQLNTIYFTLF